MIASIIMSDSLDGMKIIRQKESGNALVYVLIVIALFAALSFTLGRQTDTSEAGALSEEKAELLATQLINYAEQVRQIIEQMSFTGTTMDDYDFTLPSETVNFDTPPHIDKVYHPDGGGLIPGTLPKEAVAQSTTDPMPGWYLGQFNNVDWTNSNGTDIVLVAFQLRREVCEQLNEIITGSTAIPILNDSIKEVLIDDSLYGVGSNTDFTTTVPTDTCQTCNEKGTLCVQNQSENAYGFYSVVGQR